jgi:hypothetical protein
MDRRNSTGFTRGVVFALTFAMNERKTVAEMMGEFFRDTRYIGISARGWYCHRAKEKTMKDQFILAIAPIVSLMILVGIASIYFVRKERRESANASARCQRQ